MLFDIKPIFYLFDGDMPFIGILALDDGLVIIFVEG